MTAAEDKRNAILWTAICKRGSKIARRELLIDGSTTRVEATILGRVGKAQLEDKFSGSLTVGQPCERNVAIAAPIENLIAYVLAEIPESKRAKLLESVAQQFETHKILPDPDPSLLDAAKAWMTRLRGSRKQSVAGTVSFSPQ